MPYNLVELDGYPDPAATGQWTQSHGLATMADAIQPAEASAEIDRLRSVPDPWARPLLFSQALTGENHIARADALKQWRGLLALLALRVFYTNVYELRVHASDLNGSGGNPLLRRVLKELRPKDSVDPGLDWSVTGAITITPLAAEDDLNAGERSVGLLAPNCLVAPARGARNIKLAGVPWMQDGLADPTVTKMPLPSEQWQALFAYLKAQADLPGLANTAGGVRIREALIEYRSACLTRLGRQIPPDYAPEFEDFPANRGQLPHVFYKSILRAPLPLPVDPDKITDCQVRILERAGLTQADGEASLIAGTILIDPKIAETLGRAPDDVRLYKNYMLGGINQGNNRAQMIKAASDDKFLVITPDQIFAEKLWTLSDSAVAAHGTGVWAGYLLPLSPLAMLLVDRNEVLSRLSMADGIGGIEVGFEVDLAPLTPGGPPVRHKITKTYRKGTLGDDGDIDELVLPDVSAWPNVTTENWPWTFVNVNCNPVYDGVPRFPASLRSLAAMVRRQVQDNNNALQVLKSLGANDSLLFEQNCRAKGAGKFFDQNVADMIDADGRLIAHRLCYQKLVNDKGIGEQYTLGMGVDYIFLSRAGKPAGCALLPQQRAQLNQQPMEVGIDFGTTNTVVYARNVTKTAAMTFANRLVWLKSQDKLTDDQLLDSIAFYPAKTVESPFPTVMIRRLFDIGGWAAPVSDYLGDIDNVLFVPESTGTSSKFKLLIEREPDLDSNLKWGRAEATRLQVQRFLRQIMLMSTVEAMATGVKPENIEWHFSYPQAWGPNMRDDFQSRVLAAWTDIFSPIMNDAATQPKVKFETEGAAALRYFTDGPGGAGQANRLVLLFDIGGGSTEIGVFFRQKTKWRNSFRIAGGDFFTRFFGNNLEIFKSLRETDPVLQNALNEMSADKDSRDPDPLKDRVSRMVDLYMSQPEFTEGFSKAYPNFQFAPIGTALTQSAIVALGGMFYYTGLVLRQLIDSEDLYPEDLEEITLAFAGRGSSFFKFFGSAGDPNSRLGQLSRIMTDVALAGQPGAVPSVNALFSAAPKHEVAHGILCGEALNQNNNQRSRILPLGEAITLRGAAGKRLEATDPSAVPMGSELHRVDDAEFDRFLAALTARTGLVVHVTDQGRTIIKNIAESTLNSAMQTPGRPAQNAANVAIRLEPPFITKLRALVHLLTDPEAKRAENFDVAEHEDDEW